MGITVSHGESCWGSLSFSLLRSENSKAYPLHLDVTLQMWKYGIILIDQYGVVHHIIWSNNVFGSETKILLVLSMEQNKWLHKLLLHLLRILTQNNEEIAIRMVQIDMILIKLLSSFQNIFHIIHKFYAFDGFMFINNLLCNQWFHFNNAET